MRDFLKHVVATLKLAYLDVAFGNQGGRGDEVDIIGLPFLCVAEEFTDYPSLFSNMKAKKLQVGNTPIATVTRKKGEDVLIVFTLTDFTRFSEENLYSTPEALDEDDIESLPVSLFDQALEEYPVLERGPSGAWRNRDDK